MVDGSFWELEAGAGMTIGFVVWLAYVRMGSASVRAGQRAKTELDRYTLRQPGQEAQAEKPARSRVGSVLANWGRRLPLFNSRQQKAISRQLVAAGFRQVNALQVLVIVKVLCGAVLAMGITGAIGLWYPDTEFLTSLVAMLGGMQCGLILPELLLKMMVRRRQKQIHRILPDALDLMVICTNAGYSLSATIHTTAVEMRSICPALADELELTFQESQLHADTVASLRNLAERTGLESLRGMVSTLIQSYQYGTPITQALRVLARTERSARLLSLEEKGAKLAVKMTMPMMLLILPAVVIIIGAPAFLRISEAFGK
ncbi:MAG TPA: type II secretion system F family protein [Candidatus Sulfotelmatobacter sp.]|jgi:tight adherence protein C|nr:type II secretion system F family protein [Candidatus Sulfotelmatobacter sp.]